MRVHCPHCDGARQCDVRATHTSKWSYEEDDHHGNSVFGGANHHILECRGCETVFYYEQSWNSEEEDVVEDGNGNHEWVPVVTTKTFPPVPEHAVEIRPDWLLRLGDQQLIRLLGETYLAYEHGSYVLTAVGIRTCLDRVTEIYQIDPAISFEEKLDELHALGLVGRNERSILDLIVNAGNAAAHRGWRPDSDETGKMLRAFEAFLLRCFVLDFDAKEIEGNIPAKPRRKAKKINPPNSTLVGGP